MPYQVKIPVFEGPLDLLLHLLDKNEVDICNIPIALITQQYLEYLSYAQEVDLELTSEFLLMACTLLAIKARMLLPKTKAQQPEEEEEDPRQELVEKLIQYKLYKESAQLFKDLESQQGKKFFREIDELQLLRMFPPPNPVGDVSVLDLFSVYQHVLRKLEKKGEYLSVSREKVTIRQKIEVIMQELRKKPHGLSFAKLLEAAADRAEIIVVFLAILELARQGVITLMQAGLFADIQIFLTAPVTENEKGVLL
jgi:segregation and condensation protein A